jgi:hypothetical protein
MQRITNIQNATINAFASFELGLATVVANATAATSSMRSDAASKGSDPRKSGPSGRGWRDHGTYRRDRHPVTSVPPVERPVVGCTPTPATLPPTLWAAWVLSRSLCG